MGKKHILIFLLILLIGGFLRLYQLGNVPPAPFIDEISNGYNAYSILKTGADEYGTRFPILIRAFDDWRPSLFVYFSIPFVWMFGLTTFAIRLPSVVLSLLSIVGMYFLTREFLLLVRKRSFSDDAVTYIGLISAFLMAISPWHIYNSRFSNEPNLAITALLFAVTFFFIFLRKEKDRRGGYFLIGSWVCFALTLLAYNAEKIFIPFFALGSMMLFWRVLIRHVKILLISVMLCFFIVLPTIYSSVSQHTIVRMSAVSIAKDARLLERKSSIRIDNDATGLAKVFDNRRLILTRPFLVNYFSNFDPVWLFIGRDVTSYHLTEQGMFYVFSLPLFLLGIYMLIQKKMLFTKAGGVIILWILLAPLPSAITIEAPHVNRAYQLLPPLIMVQAVGLWFVLVWIRTIRNRFLQKGIYVFIALTISISVMNFFYLYFSVFPREKSQIVQYGIQEALVYAKENEKDYDSIVVSNRNNLRVSYMYYLFFNRYDPKLYQKKGGTKSGGLIEEHWIEKYNFVDPNTHPREPRELYIVNPGEMPMRGLHLLKKIYYLDGKEAIWIMSARLSSLLILNS